MHGMHRGASCGKIRHRIGPVYRYSGSRDGGGRMRVTRAHWLAASGRGARGKASRARAVEAGTRLLLTRLAQETQIQVRKVTRFSSLLELSLARETLEHRCMHSEAGSEEWGKLSGQPASMPRCDRCIEFRPVVRSLFAVLTKGQGSPNPHRRSTVPMYLVPHVNRASSVARATFWHLAWAFALTVACRLAGWSLTPEVVVEISSRATWEDLGRSGVSGQPASQPARPRQERQLLNP